MELRAPVEGGAQISEAHLDAPLRTTPPFAPHA